MSSALDRLSPELQDVTSELGYTALTPIQEQTIPLLLKGKDVIGQSKTGSGKTAAFILPILHKIQLRPRHVQALILCPTRELGAQVAREARKLGRRHPGLSVVAVAGGTPFRGQALQLQGGAHIVVGTPGRVLDHLRRGTLPLDAVRTLVLDEADRMLDMGFEEDLRAILKECPEHRQTALFSATFPAAIEAISREHQREAVRVTIGEEVSAPVIRQHVIESAFEDKLATLLWLIRNDKPESSIAFCNLKATAAELATSLVKAGVSAMALHGDLEQRDRDNVLAKFRNRSVRVLVATDVAARGLDIEAVDAVFNYDMPAKPEVYVHRVGRTGRAGRSGIAIAIATPREGHKIEKIEEYTGQTLQRRNAPHEKALEAELNGRAEAVAGEAAMATLRLNGGRKNKIRAGDILGALTGEAGGLPASAVGKIEIHDFFAYVAVSRPLAAAARASLLAGRIKGRKIGVELEL